MCVPDLQITLEAYQELKNKNTAILTKSEKVHVDDGILKNAILHCTRLVELIKAIQSEILEQTIPKT